MTFESYILQEKYKKVQGLGDRLELMKQQIDWNPFVEIVADAFDDNEVTGGRPHTDEKVIVRTMLLQAWYGLSDPELEFQCNDRISFQNFIGFDQTIPDFSAIWRIRNRLQEKGKDKLIWNELQRQLDQQGYQVKKGVIQDARFVHADPGKKSGMQQRGREAKTARNQDATWTKKGKKSIFGYICFLHFFITTLT